MGRGIDFSPLICWNEGWGIKKGGGKIPTPFSLCARLKVLLFD